MNIQQMHWMQNYGVLCCIKPKKPPSYVHEGFGLSGRRPPHKNKELQNEFSNNLHEYIKKMVIANSEIEYEAIFKSCLENGILKRPNGRTMTREGVRGYIVNVKFELGLIGRKGGKKLSELTVAAVELLNQGFRICHIKTKLKIKSNHASSIRRFAYQRGLLNESAMKLFEQDKNKMRNAA